MAVAAPARRSAPAPAPSRTTPPPKRRKAPARPAPRRTSRAVAAPAPARAPARKAPARRAPARTKPRTHGGQPRLALVVGRTAVAVGQLPDSSLIVRMTRGRAWIAVLGVLLAGIVALNVVNLSRTAAAAKLDAQLTLLAEENPILKNRDDVRSSTRPVRAGGRELGLAMPASDQIHFTDAGPGSVAKAAQRLAAMEP